MKKINKKGFTLIELLAVIVIMGILMLVAIPAVSRTIENTRRDTFMNTAKSYINAIKNAVSSDEVYIDGTSTPISASSTGYYCYGFRSDQDSGQDLLEQGGKSSWGNANVGGYIVINKTIVSSKTKYEYAIFMVDNGKRGINKLTKEEALKRTSVATSGTTSAKLQPTGQSVDKFDDTTTLISSGTPTANQALCTKVAIS